MAPTEIISLLSSPEYRRSSPPRPQLSPLARTSVPEFASPARASAFTILDLTGDTPGPRSRGDLAPISQDSLPRPKRLSDHNSRVNDFFQSDDFDSTGLLLGLDGLDCGRICKKPRVSGGGIATAASAASVLPQTSLVATKPTVPSVLQPAGAQRWNPAVNYPIEFTSSPDIPKSPKPSEGPAGHADDPFASSSLRRDRENAHQGPSARASIAKKATTAYLGALSKQPSPKPTSTWDPISSSAPQPDLGSDDPFVGSPPARKGRTLGRSYSEVIELGDSDIEISFGTGVASSDSELPDLDDVNFMKAKAMPFSQSRSRSQSRTTSLAKRTMPKPKKTATTKGADERSWERGEKAAAKEAEKERKRREKEREKAERLREKEIANAIAEVNKIRVDKKVSTPEMIVDIPASLSEPTRLQAETLLQDLGVPHQSWQSPVDNVIKWRRKVSSKYNDELGYWEPIVTRIDSEMHALVILVAAEFAELTLGPEGADLDSHVLKMKQHFPTHSIIYLIEGYNAWIRKNRSLRNRQFVSAVRSGLDEEGAAASGAAQPASSRRRKKATPQEYVEESIIEDALLELQIVHGALIHHTAAAVETAQWIAIFTQHISTIPYRHQKQENTSAAAFCMETGQVRSGDGPHDTYVRMLQEIARVTAPIAYGIASELGTVSDLVRGLESGGPLRLEACRKSANKDGAFSDRAVGQAVSRRIHKVFTGRDENSTNI